MAARATCPGLCGVEIIDPDGGALSGEPGDRGVLSRGWNGGGGMVTTGSAAIPRIGARRRLASSFQAVAQATSKTCRSSVIHSPCAGHKRTGSSLGNRSYSVNPSGHVTVP